MRECTCLDISCPKQRTTAGETVDADDVICLNCIIICSDWPTTLKCSTTFGYIKNDGSTDEARTQESNRQTKSAKAQESNRQAENARAQESNRYRESM
jgi:hypothetical protein